MIRLTKVSKNSAMARWHWPIFLLRSLKENLSMWWVPAVPANQRYSNCS